MPAPVGTGIAIGHKGIYRSKQRMRHLLKPMEQMSKMSSPYELSWFTFLILAAYSEGSMPNLALNALAK